MGRPAHLGDRSFGAAVFRVHRIRAAERLFPLLTRIPDPTNACRTFRDPLEVGTLSPASRLLLCHNSSDDSKSSQSSLSRSWTRNAFPSGHQGAAQGDAAPG